MVINARTVDRRPDLVRNRQRRPVGDRWDIFVEYLLLAAFLAVPLLILLRVH